PYGRSQRSHARDVHRSRGSSPRTRPGPVLSTPPRPAFGRMARRGPDGLNVRAASRRDAAGCAAIYEPYVTGTAITFEIDPPSPAEMAERIDATWRTHAWMVLEDGERVVGYAYGALFNRRQAYRWVCEVSVYLELGRRRTGGGRALYEALLPMLADRGY